MCIFVLICRNAVLTSCNSDAVIFAMNHPGLDERLVVQYLCRRHWQGRKAYAASNLIDPNTGKENSKDFLNFMLLKGVLSQRGVAVLSGKKSALNAPPPGAANDLFFSEMCQLLGEGNCVIFAPEGETNPWTCLKPFKTGIMRLGLMYSAQYKRCIKVVPISVNSIATGLLSRDVIVEVGPALTVNAEHLINASKDQKVVSARELTNQLTTTMREMCDFITIGGQSSPMAPYHNGI